ncbi:YggS family pyridoxal phosphate-dependent enzyme [Spongisporangium articulatum]|uniref:Pyridoxal phosphate homeostasis protein n=1 Tax=Spongisporangium articulatum TaxID=3362603 RepID=A0ABW8ASN0_9ACTN
MNLPTESDQPDPRLAELRAGLTGVRTRIRTAAEGAGRDPADLTLVVVTKTYPADDVRRLAGLGVREVGESRDQEAAPKADALADLGLRWHFVGRLQSNKARHVARYADVVHSLDRDSLVRPLSAGATAAGRTLECLLQVSLDDDPSRGGVAAGGLAGLADAVAAAEGLVLRGVMAVAPLGADPDAAFARLADLADGLRGAHPGATWVSAGMSGDLEAAVRHGATHLRVGSAVLGNRPRP